MGACLGKATQLGMQVGLVTVCARCQALKVKLRGQNFVLSPRGELTPTFFCYRSGLIQNSGTEPVSGAE